MGVQGLKWGSAWPGVAVLWSGTLGAWLPRPAQSHLLVLVQKQQEQQQQQDHDGHTGDKHWCEEGLIRGLYAGSWKGRGRGVSGRGGLCPPTPTENRPVLCLEHSQYSINASTEQSVLSPRSPRSLREPSHRPSPSRAGRTDPPALFMPSPKPSRSHSLLWLSHTAPYLPGKEPLHSSLS